MTAIAVQVDHPAVECRQDPLGRFSPPAFEVIHRGHVERIDALGDNLPRQPLTKITERSAFQAGHRLEELALDPDIQVKGKVHGAADEFRDILDTRIGFGAADQFEYEVQTVDQDEMAEAPTLRAPRDKDVQLAAVTLPPRV